MGDPGEYREGKIRRVPEKIGSEQVSEMGDLGEYRKWGIWASTGNVGSGRVPGR